MSSPKEVPPQSPTTAVSRPAPVSAGGYLASQLVTDRFRLDGGAMFGSVPKVLWNARIPGDALNRIQLCTRVLVLRGPEGIVLVDTGLGRKWSDKGKSIYEIEHLVDLRTVEKEILGAPVSAVILTHLHFDHGGGVSYLDDSGKAELTFPAATHFLQVDNWERAQSPGPRERATYLPENVEPLKTGNLRLTTDGEEVLPKIKVFRHRGHTAGMQSVLVGDGPGAIWFPADLVPTAHHISLPYIMGYDLCAETTLEEKTTFLRRAAEEHWWVVFVHDADTAMVQVEKDEKSGFRIKKTGALAGQQDHG